MTEKEKAKELVEKFYNAQVAVLNKNGTTEFETVEWEIAKQSAIITVDEIINSRPLEPIIRRNPYFEQISDRVEEAIEHWQQVKTEIENL